jgi:hypothetical protein
MWPWCVSLTDNWLRAGSHTFDFHFNLPPRLPSTFNSKIGHISYFVQALCLDREHILAKKKLYLLVQGISEFRQRNLSEVPRHPGDGSRNRRDADPGSGVIPHKVAQGAAIGLSR